MKYKTLHKFTNDNIVEKNTRVNLNVTISRKFFANFFVFFSILAFFSGYCIHIIFDRS